MTRREALENVITMLGDSAPETPVLKELYDKLTVKGQTINKADRERIAQNCVTKVDIVVAIQSAGVPLSVSELNSQMGTSYSANKISALMTQLKAEGKIVVIPGSNRIPTRYGLA